MSRRGFAVVVPHESALAQLSDLPDGVRLRLWDGSGDFPSGDEPEIWVPPFGPADVASIVQSTPSLRVLQLPTAGADRLPRQLRDGVSVHTARGVHDGAVSEWVLAAILAANRRLPDFVRAQQHAAPRRVLGRVLDGSRIVLLGYGSVGQAVERRLAGFEVEVVRVARIAREGVLGVADLGSVLPDADVLVVLAPLTVETAGLVTAAHLAALPDGALVVNAGRGEVVEQESLFEEIRKGRLRAALDVAVPDPLPDGHPILQEPGLVYTAHVAGATDDTYRRVNRFVRAQILRYAAGEPLLNPLDRM